MKSVLGAARGWLVGTGVALGAAVAVGYLPTVRLGGEGAAGALWLGCAIAALGALAGAAPVLLALASGGATKPHVTAGWAMALRSGVTLAGTAAAALGSELPRGPLVAWVAIGYGALLIVETRWTLRWLVAGAGQ